MDFLKTEISGVVLVTPFYSADDRGSVIKDYSEKNFLDNGIEFVPKETLYISSQKKVLRGLHFQRIKGQAKLIRCIIGSIFGVVVDLRLESPTLGRWISYELDQKRREELFIPDGCAFGSLALEDALIVCKCGENYYKEYDDGIKWNDTDLNIRWPIKDNLIISPKDRKLQSFRSYLMKAREGIE